MPILRRGEIFFKDNLYWQRYIDTETRSIHKRWSLDLKTLQEYNKQFKKQDPNDKWYKA